MFVLQVYINPRFRINVLQSLQVHSVGIQDFLLNSDRVVDFLIVSWDNLTSFRAAKIFRFRAVYYCAYI